jgi:NADPH-dependent 2,4-dienoyl-CoA reductase/sulfur reductase-like enzyme/rhodanese-related sulfurtransferase
MKKILVVGGVAGGASFAARMRRLDETAQIIMFDKGDYISFANCGLPYFIGNTIKERDKLIIQTPEKFKERFGVDVRIRSEVVSINAGAKTITVRGESGTYNESYDYLLLAPGAQPIRPSLQGFDSPLVHTLRTVPDADSIREMVDGDRVRSAVVIGGGFIGLEMAENLRHRGIGVTLVEMLDQVFAAADREMAGILHQHLTMNGIVLRFGHGVTRILDNGAGTASVLLDDGSSIDANLVILAIGVKPDTGFCATPGIALSSRGAIVVDDHLRTSDPYIYAAGDAVEVVDYVSGQKAFIPLAGPANRQGRIAADTIAGIPSTYKKTQGTAICKVFDLTVAVTGINEKNATRLGIPVCRSYTHSSSHASYYPGAFPLSIKLMFSPQNRKVLGAQVIGREGVDKRIDLFATAVRHGLTVDDCAELELAYAPPFGSARDPVNIAGMVAGNILDGRMPVFYAEEVAGIDSARQTLLDVRTAGEYFMGTLPDATLIPLDSLRDRLNELDKNKEILVYCQIGLRGYLAVRILAAAGFRAKNLSGGYKTWSSLNSPDYDGTYVKQVIEPACTTPMN